MHLFDFAVLDKREGDNVATLILCGHTEGREAPAVSSQMLKCEKHVSDVSACLQIINTSHMPDMYHCNVATYYSICYSILA